MTELVHYDIKTLYNNDGSKFSLKEILEQKIELEGKSMNIFGPYNNTTFFFVTNCTFKELTTFSDALFLS